MRDAKFRKPITFGNGMRMSKNGMSCTGCGMAYNDKFIFENVALQNIIENVSLLLEEIFTKLLMLFLYKIIYCYI
jgi:hypothetical protein